ncbi:MAG: YceD family protein [Cyanobacteriota bacterium]
MEAIYIPQLLNAPEKTEEIEVNQCISGLDTLTPVRGRITVRHGGTYLEVSAVADAIVTLTCDRCLQQYNHRLSVDTTELIWLEEKYEDVNSLPLERELKSEDLSENLSPYGHFEPEAWLYEQLCLAHPQRQLCNQDCGGFDSEAVSKNNPVDSRWAKLEALKRQLSS